MPFNEDGSRKEGPLYKKSGFKMKGSPMQRNFGIGSPMRDEKTSKIGKAKSLLYAIKTGFTNPNVEDLSGMRGVYDRAKSRSRKGEKIDISGISQADIKKYGYPEAD